MKSASYLHVDYFKDHIHKCKRGYILGHELSLEDAQTICNKDRKCLGIWDGNPGCTGRGKLYSLCTGWDLLHNPAMSIDNSGYEYGCAYYKGIKSNHVIYI